MEKDLRAIVLGHVHGSDCPRDAFIDVAADILERASAEECGDASDKVRRAIDDGLIYDDDKWEVMRQYCEVECADYARAEEALFEDVVAMMEEAYEVRAYYDGRLMGLESFATFDETYDVPAYVWDKIQRGLYVVVKRLSSGKPTTFDPDFDEPDNIAMMIAEL